MSAIDVPCSLVTVFEGIRQVCRKAFINATVGLLSFSFFTCDRGPVKVHQRFGLTWSFIIYKINNHLRYLLELACPFRNFYRGQKVRNLASIFDITRLSAARVSKRSKISEIWNKVGELRWGPMFSSSLVKFGLHTPENYSRIWAPLKIGRRKCGKSSITALMNKDYDNSALRSLPDCSKIWLDDATTEVAVLSKLTSGQNQNCRQHVPHFVKNSNSSFDTTCLWAACVSRRSKISELWNKFSERRWLSYVFTKFNEVRSTNTWEPSEERGPNP